MEYANTNQLIPESNAMSVLAGDGLTNPPEITTIQSMMQNNKRKKMKM